MLSTTRVHVYEVQYCLQERSQEPDAREEQTTAPAGTSSSARTLADVWEASSPDAAGQSSSAAADRGLLARLQQVQAGLTSRVSGNPPAADTKIPSSVGSPKSFLDSIRDNGPVMSQPQSTPSNSARTESEEIRASRQRRMQEQGLDGRGSTGWRTGDGSEDGALTEASSFSDLLSSHESGPESASLSAEQFTLYARFTTPF